MRPGPRVIRWPLISMVADRWGAQGLDELLDPDAGGVLQVTGHSQGGEHDGQVRLDRVALMVEDGPGAQVDLVMRNDCSTRHRSW